MKNHRFFDRNCIYICVCWELCEIRPCSGQQAVSLRSTAVYCQTANESTNPIDHPDKVSNGCSHTDKIHIKQVYRHGYRTALESESGPSGGIVAWGDAKGRHSPLTWPHECQFVFRLLRFIFTWRRTNSGKQAASGSKPEQKGRVPTSAVFT